MRPVVIIPLSGLGSRFPREKWLFPKPLIRIDHRSIIEWTMDCIDSSGCDLVFIVRDVDVKEFSIDAFLKNRFGQHANIVIVSEPTRGAVETCMAAKKFIRPDCPLIIHCSDVFFEPKFSAADFQCQNDGCILTFKSNSNNYSYSQVGEDRFVTKVAEKKVISEHASAGLYWFKRGEDFIRAAKRMISGYSGIELHIAPLYNLLIEDKKKVSILDVEKMFVFGTPEEFSFFKSNILKSFPRNKKVVAVCSDHSGFTAKEIFKTLAEKRGLHVLDFGTHDTHDVNYNIFVKAACDSVLSGVSDFGFGFCRSGQGVNIAANKVKGIRSVLCYNDWAARMGVKHSCGNFFAVSEKHCSEKEIELILEEVMINSFDGGRHQTRLQNNDS